VKTRVKLERFDFLWNNRQMNDGERTIAATKSAEGKRLRYQDQMRNGNTRGPLKRKKAVSNLNHSKKKATPGPKADRLKLKGDWKALVKQSLSKKKPAEGWPK
jgi:hypothetical protein